MQKRMRKFIVLIFLSFFSFTPLFAQVSQYRLYTADSLFEAKRYTQALSKYEGVLQNNEYTPAMLLKMAYIHEGLGNIAKTQYFLNLYFLSTNDASALDKIAELAVKHNLRGYEDAGVVGQIIMMIQENVKQIIFVLAGLLMLSMAWLARAKRKTKRPVGPVIAVLLCIVFILNGFFGISKEETAIIAQPNTYLMSGPSAGSDLIDIVDAGHKLTITGKKDVWLEARLDGQTVYVKQEKLMLLTL
ncbi:SH3 domain-containing protein [Chryseotalea sanaruensis]|uniref:SH3 domain-containing protein n=2 Tax=Chryseotalea sanaruensis TaxID=2482724 RepID=A0A401UCY9_9BACT|nr:SH3 domain-containing protein [Chryseotalea sanaruensis]